MNQEENIQNSLKNDMNNIDIEGQNDSEEYQEFQDEQQEQVQEEFPTFQRAQLKSFFQDQQSKLLMSAQFSKQFNKTLSIFLLHLQFQLRYKKGPNKKINADDIIKMMNELNLGEMNNISE